jgi:Family of unknown function (DUF5989)/Carbamoyltransferase N-terminus
VKRASAGAILGISAYYHDSAAALLRDGEIVAAAQEERFSRAKHDARFPARAARWCLDHRASRRHAAQARSARDDLSRAEPRAAPGSHGEALLMLDLVKDLWGYMRTHEKFWLAPIFLSLLALGALLVLAQGSAVAPFIYTLF